MSAPHRKSWPSEPNLPVTYPRLYLEVAAERGVSAAAILAHTQVKVERLADPLGRVSPLEFVEFLSTVLALAGNAGIGIEVGLRQPLTAHGSVGLAMMCSASVGDAAQLLLRYWYLRGRGIDLAYTEQGEMVAFDFIPAMPMPDAVRFTLLDSMLAGFHSGLSFALGGGPVEAGQEIWVEYPRPAYARHFAARLPPVRYGMPSTQYRAPRLLLGQPLATANPETLNMALALCEREYALLDVNQDDILRHARAAMRLGPQGYPLPEQLAEALHLSPRTLRRRLLVQGSNYRQLQEDARRRDALQLLENVSLEIRQIAELLGYADPANFTRAFRQWTGKTPSGYRELKGL